MHDSLQVLLTIFTAVLLMNSVSAFVVWRYEKNDLYKIVVKIWVACFINFLLQGIFQTPGPLMLLSFGTYAFCALYLVELFYSAQKKVLNKNPFYIIIAASWATGLGLLFADFSFQIAAVPVAIGTSTPMFYKAIKVFRNYKKYQNSELFFAFILFVNAAHFLDYPVLRQDGYLGAIMGFSFALMILFSLSVFLPGFVLRNIHREYTEQLENEVAERTLSLSQTNKELVELSHENRSLINILCHDLATPISVLNTNFFYMSNLGDDGTPAAADRMAPRLEMAQRALKSINDILEKVKHLEALKSGKIRIDLQPVDLRPQLQEALNLFQDRLVEKKLSVRWDYQLPSDIRIWADASILRNQVLNNLISNAIKFSEEGTEILVSAVLAEDKVLLSIRDQGVGIPEKLMSRLFEFETNTTRRGTKGEKGTGFGLPLVRTCVEKFGAHISVTSHPKEVDHDEHGSTFLISFKKAA